MKKIISTLLMLPAICCANLHGKKGIDLVDNLDIQKDWTLRSEQEPDSGYAGFLLKMDQLNTTQSLKINQLTSQYDSDLKKNLSSITLANSFKEVPLPDGGEVIGYAPIGSYKKNGWTGAKEFFTSPELGVCSYSKSPFIYMQLIKSAAKYSVNNKLTTIDFEGNPKTGYLTSVSWYEQGRDNFEYRLECATKKLNKEVKSKMIALASAIDLET